MHPDVEHLIHQAETAMRNSKAHKRDKARRIHWYTPEMAERDRRRTQVQHWLDLETRDMSAFHLAYQPVVRMDNGFMVGVEALVRWNSPNLGAVSPAEFIPIAEARGIIQRITEYVLQQAIQQAAHWQHYRSNFTVSLNVSPLDIEREGFVERVEQTLQENSITGKLLGLEVTEHEVYSDLTRYQGKLERLKRRTQVRLKVDDFGQGRSGLASLMQFQFDELKLDREFIPKNATDQARVSVCETVAQLGRSFGMGLVGEGIENLLQAELIASLGFEYGQGYYFGHPMPADKITALLRAV